MALRLMNNIQYFQVVGNSTITVFGDTNIEREWKDLTYERIAIEGYKMKNVNKHHIFFNYTRPDMFPKYIKNILYRVWYKEGDSIIIHYGNFEKRIIEKLGVEYMDGLYRTLVTTSYIKPIGYRFVVDRGMKFRIGKLGTKAEKEFVMVTMNSETNNVNTIIREFYDDKGLMHFGQVEYNASLYN